MKSFEIPYSSTNQFSKLVIDYLNEGLELKPFISHFPRLEKFEKQIVEKQSHKINRKILVEILRKQNSNLSLSEQSRRNIKRLLSENTFSITTGHQLCLFTGPLYFIYKIISSLNLSKKLRERYPKKDFIPIFWMATEDHDFQEVNHINLFGEKIEWDSKQSGPVGQMKTEGIRKVLEELKVTLGKSENAQQLIQLFENAYLKQSSLADATRYLVNELFGKYGILIIDGDDKRLKEQFLQVIKKDILQNGFVKSIQKCNNELVKNYKVQAHVRDVNFFKLSNEKRELIKGGVTANEIEKEPEKFSPNVLMRPLYQESILPNIAYVGGGSEVGYWMQLKIAFKQEKIPFPILILRNSAMLISTKQFQRVIDLGFVLEDLFLEETKLHKQYIQMQTSSISLEKELETTNRVFDTILERIVDKNLQSTIKAEKQKQLKSLQKLEKKLLKSEKRQHKIALEKISKLKKNLFPNNSLQERFDNFIPFYLKHGENFIEILLSELNPLAANFVILPLQ